MAVFLLSEYALRKKARRFCSSPGQYRTTRRALVRQYDRVLHHCTKVFRYISCQVRLNDYLSQKQYMPITNQALRTSIAPQISPASIPKIWLLLSIFFRIAQRAKTRKMIKHTILMGVPIRNGAERATTPWPAVCKLGQYLIKK